MKNSTLIPLFSLCAAAAFGLGWTMNPGSSSEESGDLSAENRKSSRDRLGSSRRSSRSGSDDAGAGSEFLARYLVDGSIAPTDMEAVMKEITDTNDPILRQKMFAALLENLTPDNAKEAFLALRKNSRGGPFGRGGDEQLRLLANAWGRIDGPGAVAALKELAASEEGEGDRGRGGWGRDRGPGELGSVLSGWATVDGAAASAYVASIEDEREQRGAAFGVIQGMLVNGVDEAMSFIKAMPTSEEGDRARGIYMAMVTGEMLEQGLDQTKSWVDTVKDPDLRSGALTRVTMEIMQKDREQAAEWIAQYGNEEAASFAVNRLADDWSREDPKAVMDWANQLSGNAKAQAYEETMQNWARQDAAAAGEFLRTLTDSPERDAAVEGYATRVSREDPAGAMAWAETITNAESRQQAVIEVAQDWYRQDRTAAEQWIQNSGLNEEAVKSITEPPRDFRRGGPFGGGR